MNLVTDVDLMKRYYGNDNGLDNTDKFLRNYILMEGWKEKDKGKIGKMNKVDKED
jgi:hypothetical protein